MLDFFRFLVGFVDSAFEEWRGRIWTIALWAAFSFLAMWVAAEVWSSTEVGMPRRDRFLFWISTFTLIALCALLWPRKKSKASVESAANS